MMRFGILLLLATAVFLAKSQTDIQYKMGRGRNSTFLTFTLLVQADDFYAENNTFLHMRNVPFVNKIYDDKNFI